MSYEIPEEEVAQDFAAALADLSMNSRYEISNLTVIARENTASALAISEALKSHIKQTSPAKKLPAFYVLDSIIKNVGTPYTLFFGRQLYSTFMEAYALVDNNVRSKMVEMLKTWKEPVPGSMDSRPVFPPEVTRPIENALIKARTSFLQAHQEQTRSQQSVMGRGRPMPSSTPYRETPTPPGNYRAPPPQSTPGFAPNYPAQQYPPPMNAKQYPPQAPPAQQYQQMPPNGQQYPTQQNGYQPHGLPPRPPSQQYSQPPPNAASWQQQYPNQPQSSYQAQPPSMGYASTEDSLAALNSDIENLINESKAEWSRNPHEVSFQTKLKALFDLQTILRSQTLPPDQISLIQNQVAQLKKAPQSAPIMQTPQAPLPPTPVVATPAPAQQPTLSSILGPGAQGALAALLARQSATPQTSSAVPATIRSPQQANIPPYQPPPSVTPAATPIPDPNSLLGRLRAAGMLPGLGATTSAPTPTVSTPTLASPPFMNTPPTSARTPLGIIPNDVVLKPASLKIPRPHLLAGLYEHLGAPCTQCGRRFQSDEEGKKKKAAHMDWHFHVRQRMDEAESRGQHRSWYVDELDWIKSREVEGETTTTTDPSQNTSAAKAAKKSKQQYIPAPDDPTLASVPCPICQEKFEMKWLDDAQEFVWMDAMKVGEKIYHASCFTEATKDVNTQAKRGTPEPVLGKRKAEDDGFAFRAKIKSEA